MPIIPVVFKGGPLDKVEGEWDDCYTTHYHAVEDVGPSDRREPTPSGGPHISLLLCLYKLDPPQHTVRGKRVALLCGQQFTCNHDLH